MKFDDILMLDEWQMCKLLQNVTSTDVSYAIHGAPDDLREKTLNSLLNSVQDMVLEDEAKLPMDERRIEEAREVFVQQAIKIKAKGWKVKARLGYPWG